MQQVKKTRKKRANLNEMTDRHLKERLERVALEKLKAEQLAELLKGGNGKTEPKTKRKRKGKTYTPAQLKKLEQMRLDRKNNRAKYLTEKYTRINEREAYQAKMLEEQKKRQKKNPDEWQHAFDADLLYSVPDNCTHKLEKELFSEGETICPHCKHNEIYRYKRRDIKRNKTREIFKCKKCRRQFSCRTNTILSKSKIPLPYWFKVLLNENINTTKMKIREVRDLIPVSQKTAVYMLHRIRHAAFNQDIFTIEQNSTVAIDTVAIFGSNVNRHDCDKYSAHEIPQYSAQYITMKQNNGNVLIKYTPDLTEASKRRVIKQYIPVGCAVYTDEHAAFKFLGEEDFIHETVNHSLGEHGRGKVSNNGAESVHATLKSALKGHFNCFRQKHLHLFVNAMVFQKNTNNLKLTLHEKFSLSLQNLLATAKPIRIKPSEQKLIKMSSLKKIAIRMNDEIKKIA